MINFITFINKSNLVKSGERRQCSTYKSKSYFFSQSSLFSQFSFDLKLMLHLLSRSFSDTS